MLGYLTPKQRATLDAIPFNQWVVPVTTSMSAIARRGWLKVRWVKVVKSYGTIHEIQYMRVSPA